MQIKIKQNKQKIKQNKQKIKQKNPQNKLL